MKRFHLILLGLGLICFSSLYAQDCVQDYDGFDYIVLKDSTNVYVTPNGSGAFNIVKSIKIQTVKGGVDNRTIIYDYDPLTAFAEFKYVRVLRADGTLDQLNPKEGYDYAAPARAIYWGARQIMFEVGKLDPGDILEYEIEKKGFTYALLSDGAFEAMPGAGATTGAIMGSATMGGGAAIGSPAAADNDDSRFVPPMEGEFYDIVPFWVAAPTLKKVYRLSIPMEKEIQFEFYHGESESSMKYEGERKVYMFSMVDVLPFKSEPNMVSLFDAAPKLFLSSTPNWMMKSSWFYNVNEDYGSFDAYGPAQKKVDEIIKGKKTDMEKIAALTHWVADNIRYSGVSMGEGEGFTLHNTEMNFTDRCGVCKDIAALLVSFLRMAGFEAYPAMTMAGSTVETIPADHFNHCVAVVKLGDGTYMPLDPTWVPFVRELWSSAEQQQNYLPGVPESSDLCITPVSAPENHYFRIKANSVLADNGTLKGEFTLSAEGQSDSRIRGMFTTGWRSEWYNALEKQLLEMSPKARMVSVDYGKDPKDYQAAPISITFKYVIPDYAFKGEDELVFKPVVMNNVYNSIRTYLRIDTSLEERKYDFKDACSRLVELDETITLPNGYKMINSELNDDFESSVADFEGELTQTGNKINLTQVLALKKREYLAEDWADFRTALLKHKEFGNYIIIKK